MVLSPRKMHERSPMAAAKTKTNEAVTWKIKKVSRLSSGELSGDSKAKAAADQLGRDLEAMGYKLDCESFITKGTQSTDNTSVERYATPTNQDAKTKKKKEKQPQQKAKSPPPEDKYATKLSQSDEDDDDSSDASDDESTDDSSDDSDDSDSSDDSSSSSDSEDNENEDPSGMKKKKQEVKKKDAVNENGAFFPEKDTVKMKKKIAAQALQAAPTEVSSVASKPSVVEIKKVPMKKDKKKSSKGSKTSYSTITQTSSTRPPRSRNNATERQAASASLTDQPKKEYRSERGQSEITEPKTKLLDDHERDEAQFAKNRQLLSATDRNRSLLDETTNVDSLWSRGTSYKETNDLETAEDVPSHERQGRSITHSSWEGEQPDPNSISRESRWRSNLDERQTAQQQQARSKSPDKRGATQSSDPDKRGATQSSESEATDLDYGMTNRRAKNSSVQSPKDKRSISKSAKEKIDPSSKPQSLSNGPTDTAVTVATGPAAPHDHPESSKMRIVGTNIIQTDPNMQNGEGNGLPGPVANAYASLSTDALKQEEADHVVIDGMSVLGTPLSVKATDAPQPKRRMRFWLRKPKPTQQQAQPTEHEQHKPSTQKPNFPDKHGAGLMLEESVIARKRNIFGKLFHKKDVEVIKHVVPPSPVRVIEIENEDGFQVELIADDGLSPESWLEEQTLIDLLGPNALEHISNNDFTEEEEIIRTTNNRMITSIDDNQPSSPFLQEKYEKESLAKTHELADSATKEVVEDFAREFAKKNMEISTIQPFEDTKPSSSSSDPKMAISPVHRQGSTQLATSFGDLFAVLRGTHQASPAPRSNFKESSGNSNTNSKQHRGPVEMQARSNSSYQEDCCKNQACSGFDRFCQSKALHSDDGNFREQRSTGRRPSGSHKASYNGKGSNKSNDKRSKPRQGSKPEVSKKNTVTSGSEKNSGQATNPSANSPSRKAPTQSQVHSKNKKSLMNRFASPTAMLSPEEEEFTFALSGEEEQQVRSFDWHNGYGNGTQARSKVVAATSKPQARSPTSPNQNRHIRRAASPGPQSPRTEHTSLKAVSDPSRRGIIPKEMVTSYPSDDEEDFGPAPSMDKQQSLFSAMVIEVPQKKKKPSRRGSPKRNESSTPRARGGRGTTHTHHNSRDRNRRNSTGPEYIRPKHSNRNPVVVNKTRSRKQSPTRHRKAPLSKEAVRQFAKDWARLGDATHVLEQVMSSIEENQSTGTLDEAEMLLAAGGDSHLGDVEKALSTLKKHAKKMGVKETDLLIATAKSYDSGAFSDISFTMGEEFMNVLSSYLRFQK